MELLPQAELSYSEETQHGIWIEIHWRYFRAARARQDEAVAAKEADQTLRLGPTDPAVALDLIPWLADHGRGNDAAQLAAATLAAHSDDDALRARLAPFQPRQ
jgi:hypothetical protein